MFVLQTLSNQLQCFSFTIIHIPSASICNLISSLFCDVSNICDMRRIIKFLTTSLRFSVIVLPNHLLRDVCTEEMGSKGRPANTATGQNSDMRDRDERKGDFGNLRFYWWRGKWQMIIGFRSYFLTSHYY